MKEPSQRAVSGDYPFNLLKAISNYLDDTADFPLNKLTDDQLKGLEYAISTLSPRHKELIQLLYIHGADYETIARTFGVSVSSISSSLTQALKSFRYNGRSIYITKGYQGTLSLSNSVRMATVASLPLPISVINLLNHYGIHTTDQLCALCEADLRNYRNVGPSTVAHIRRALAICGRTLAGEQTQEESSQQVYRSSYTCNNCLYFSMCRHIASGDYTAESEPCDFFDDRSDYEKNSEIHKLRQIQSKADKHGGIDHLVALDNAALTGHVRVMPCKAGDTVYFVKGWHRKQLVTFICGDIILTSNNELVLSDINGHEYLASACHFSHDAALAALNGNDSSVTFDEGESND